MAVRHGGAAPSQAQGTTQQDNKSSLSLSMFLSPSLSLFLSPAESGNRNLKAASSFHILSTLLLMVLDTQRIFLA